VGYFWPSETYETIGGSNIMSIIQNIKQLRQETGLGMLECKEALDTVDNDVEAAKIYLRKRGLKDKDRGHRPTKEGFIGNYTHTGGRISVMVEINSETDFAARSMEVQVFAQNLAMHIAAVNPRWISRDDVPNDILEREMDILSSGLDNKPEQIREKILSGRLNKFYKSNCLLEQPFVRDPKSTVEELFNDLKMKVKENIEIKRFSRFEVGSE